MLALNLILISFLLPPQEHLTTAEVMDAVLPFEALPASCVEGVPRWRITVRMIPAWGGPEELWTLDVSWDGSAVLTVKKVQGPGISSLSLEQATSIPKIDVSTRRLDDQECPALRSSASRIGKVKIPFLPENFLCLDDDRFEVFLDTCWGSPRRLNFTDVQGGYSGDEPKSKSFVNWFYSLRKRAKKCTRLLDRDGSTAPNL